jgi:predicted NAD/FAD-dependent oxidoreductase
MSVIVVGAGISGVACAQALRTAGVSVRVLERAHTVGGRMASRRLQGRPVDLGAAYFTVTDPEFAELVARWRTVGLARPWTTQLAVLADGGRDHTSGPMRWAATAGLRSLVQELAGGLDVELERQVCHVGPGPAVDGEVAEIVVLAMPDPQALRLVHPSSPAATELADRAWRPSIAVAAGWPSRQWDPLPAAFVNGHPVVTTIADDGDRRGDGAAVLVTHTTAESARAHDAAPDAAVPMVLDALRELLDVRAAPEWTHAHRWRFAAPDTAREQPYFLGPDGIALAGDGWGPPKVETAWRSGTLLARAVVERLAAG